MSNHEDNDRLIAEFLAKGGEIRRMERGARSEVVAPLVKRRATMAKLKAKAAQM